VTTLMTTSGNGAHPGRVTDVPDPQVPERATRRRFTAAYKLRIVEAYDAATEPGAKGALLRREGLYSSHIVAWRNARDAGAIQGLDRKRGRKPADAREAEVARLRRRAERAEAELVKARLIIDVQGKVSALLDVISESAEPPKGSTP
jgi:transposase